MCANIHEQTTKYMFVYNAPMLCVWMPPLKTLWYSVHLKIALEKKVDLKKGWFWHDKLHMEVCSLQFMFLAWRGQVWVAHWSKNKRGRQHALNLYHKVVKEEVGDLISCCENSSLLDKNLPSAQTASCALALACRPYV